MSEEEAEEEIDWQTREVKWMEQIQKFKNKEAYRRYRIAVSNKERRGNENRLPVTPRLSRQDKVVWRPSNPVISVTKGKKRQFYGMLKKWKQLIYQWNNTSDIFIPQQLDCMVCGGKVHYLCLECKQVGFCSYTCRDEAFQSNQHPCEDTDKK